VLALMVGMLMSMLTQTSFLWRSTMGHVQQFQRAREAFQILTTRLSDATLNTYWDYARDANGNPTQYIRQSELRFLCGQGATLVGPTALTHAVFFQAPGGVTLSGSVNTLPGALSTWGYYVAYGSDANYRPPVLNGNPGPPANGIAPRYRYRLFEMMEPSDQLSIYNYTSGTNGSGASKNSTYTGTQWYQNALALGPARTRILAENVVAMILLPKLPEADDPTGTALAPSYSYDSTVGTSQAQTDPKNQLPPLVQVTLVVVEENSHVNWTATPPNVGLAGLFQSAAQETQDLNTLETNLRGIGLNPHHFSLTVSLPAAKWSTNQTQ
jgi:uncharacterized protein (TIGR02599 family)